LCYHAVSDSWEHSLAVRPASFERQVRRVSSLYGPLTAEEVVFSGRRGMHVTFDDAFRSIIGALAILERLNVHATVFVSTSYADDGKPLDVPELAEEAAAHPSQLATLDWHDLRAIADAGFEVGSHTVTHPHLTHLSEWELERELVESRERMEDELERPCRFLAYPYGEEDDRVRGAAEAAGYAAAFALSSGFDQPDRFAIPRVGIWRTDYALRAAAKIAIQHARKPTGWYSDVETP
jgi:peptidoglycan/xylan/chitin deacetylase (PgdA/CDA1 family)